MNQENEAPSEFLSDPSEPVDLLIIAAEQSGDEHGRTIVEAYRDRYPEARVYAVGGANLAESGAHFLFNLVAHSVMGFFEVLRQHSFFRRILREIVQWIRRHRPRQVCFIDSPALNLRIAAQLYRYGVSHRSGGDVYLYHYIAPQVWAWKAQRRFTMARYLDSLGVIFPFEVKCFADTSLPTVFTGHPFVEPGHVSPIHYEANDRIFLLPGSRRQSIGRIFPIMLETFRLLENQNLEAVCLYPSRQIAQLLEDELKKFPTLSSRIHLLPIDEAMKNPIGARATVVASGTMSLRCALQGIPGVVVYRTSPLTYWLASRLVQVRHLAMANLLLGYELYPEYIQQNARPATMAKRMEGLLHGRAEFEEVSRELRKILQADHTPTIDWLSPRTTP